MLILTKEELTALSHALANTLCQKDHPDWAVLFKLREKVRTLLEVMR